MNTRIVVESGNTYRNTNASMEQVVEAFAQLVSEVHELTRGETPAVKNARRVVMLLGHTLPELAKSGAVQ
jgi:hypothetical protein